MIQCPRTGQLCYNLQCGKTTGICDPTRPFIINQAVYTEEQWRQLTADRDHYKALAEAAAYLMSPSAAKNFPVAYNKYWQLKHALKTQTPDREQRIIEGL